MAITTHDIHAAANAIAAEGHSPTLAAVRKALGGGSFTTLSEAMRDWKARRQACAATAPIHEAAPASISERLHVFGSEIWVCALDMANARLLSEREALEQVRQELEAAQAEAIDLADQLSAEIEQAQATIQQQQDALARAELEALEHAARLENERAARLETERKGEVTAAAMAEVRRRVEDFKAEVKALRTEVLTTAQKLAIAESKLN